MENKHVLLPTAGLLVIKENKILLAFSKNKQAWYLPGGKLNEGETSEEALIREIKEELGVTLKKTALQFLTHISATAYGEAGLTMEQDCYLCPLEEEVRPSAEIVAARYFSVQEYAQEQVRVEGVIKAFEILILKGLIL
ncbi:NUDIX hydrolase [Sphingobacterium suaedae]|uniref:NUDIX domain-containing protein n=1 Tax=Sphingobacterium suaedae TaxID=1686402 RepID=A0ABW5KFT3_9SPHI